MSVIIEPFRIKSVEPIYITTREEREAILKEAKFNLFQVRAHHVIIDLLTDSGTSAMSSKQWSGIMEGDESYAGSDSFYRFESAVKNITGMEYIIPTHQGRAAEKILFTILGGKGKYFVSNTFFDTTRANIEYSGATAIDLLCEEGKITSLEAPFKGNIDTAALLKFIREKGEENIPLVMLTITNNSGGGQPVSMENIRETKKICDRFKIPLYIDACRFAENSFFIKTREKGYEDKSILHIAREIFSYADGCTMSAKKDAFANIGGFLALNNPELTRECRNLLIITEGFPTYGGLAGRDLEAIAIGLEEVLHEDYLRYRIRSIQYLGEKLETAGVPFLKPTGGHAIYLDAKSFLPHIPPHQFPGQALCCSLYEEGGIRSVEIGTLMFGKYDKSGAVLSPPHELVRLAIPRRVYTQSHIDFVGEIIIETFHKRKSLRGLKIKYEATLLRHFTVELEKL
jgi:tryptophanase